MKRNTLILLGLVSAMSVFHACKKDKDSKEDEALYGEIAGATFNYLGGATLGAAGNSPHGNFKLRFNSTANAALDSTGELPAGSSFPNGSLLVKEVVSGGSTTLYAVMKKAAGDANAGSNWLWAEYKPGGETVISLTKKGADGGCVSCHSGNVNRDLTNTFDLH